MIVAAHQPHFLPWLGYLNKAARSDVFIWLDTVQFRKNYFQNRTRVAGADGQERWLTVPVHAHLDTPIRDVGLADPRWSDRVVRTVEQLYGKAQYFGSCWEPLRAELSTPSEHLADVNLRLFRTLLRILSLDGVGLVVASELPIDAIEPTDRLVKLCQAVGATAYVAGKGGRQYMREDAFTAAGIDIVWQQFDAQRTAYPRGAGAPVVGLSVIDCLFHAGPERTRELVEAGWTP